MMKKLHKLIAIFILLLRHEQVFADVPFYDFGFNVLSALANISNPLSILNPPKFVELASLYGHPAEKHEVTTEDGYILTLFRLRGNRTAFPVLLFHGVLDSCDSWVIRGHRSLAITLANNNYDVWLANARGNRYSQGHIYLNPKLDPEYWNFSFDEHGLYDLPACIDYILNNTGAQKLNMFGHSQGNTMMWVLLSTRTEYNDKINVATALAPVCYGDHVLEPIPTLLRLLAKFYPLLKALGVTSVIEDHSVFTILVRLISQIPILGYFIITYKLIFPLMGTDITEFEPSFLPTAVMHAPTSTSLKNGMHFSQVVIEKRFARFNYGASGNLAAYNSTTAPAYDLRNIRTKIVLLAAKNDKLSQLADVDTLRKQLRNVIQYIVNPRVIMNHIDYIWGRTAPSYLYGYIFHILEKL